MRTRASLLALSVGLALAVVPASMAQSERAETAADDVDATITGDAGAVGMPMSARLYGIFYEDINHAADGGLYAELVQNRSFEFDPVDNSSYNGLTAWSVADRGGASGTVEVASDDPLNASNLHYLRLTTAAPGSGETAGVAIRNASYNTGIAVESGKSYDFSFWARRDGSQDVPVRVAVEDVAGTTGYGSTESAITSDRWTRYEGTLTATGATTEGRLSLVVGGQPAAGTHVDFDMVSLFPRDTYLGRDNGMRKDIAEMIADLEPAFLRFPGGCLVNAGSFEPFPVRNRVYDWKDTIGPVEERPTNRNFWGYNHTYGIGYYEYFQFAADLGAEPLPVVNVGVNGCGLHDQNRLTTPEQLEPWIQDTLDLIEFANGDVTTEWGAVRAELGHPEPFGLEYIGLGNEEYDAQFVENYPHFHHAVRAAYPDVKIISNSGTSASGDVFERNWQLARELGADLVDEHYYVDQTFLLSNDDRYDDYDRDGPHVFVGEFAARSNPANYNNFFSALSEAAYMTGIERNSDVVELASYAPLLANASYVNWSPDLIWFDNHRGYGTPSYYVQRMYSHNRGDTVIPTTLEAGPVEEEVGRVAGQYGNAVRLNGPSPNQYVDLPDGIVSDLTDFTVATWVNPATVDTWSRVFDFGNSETVNMFLTPDAGGAAGLRFAITAQGNCCEQQLTAASPLPANQWTHVAVTLSGTSGTLYVNGEPVATNPNMTLNPSSLGATSQNWIGRSQYPDPLLNGTVDEFQIYDRALTEAEVGSLLDSAGGTPGGGNVAWYRFDEPSGAAALDSSGNERTATIVTTNSTIKPLYQVVTRDENTGDIVLKVVNARTSPMRTQVDLGPLELSDTGTVTTLSAARDAMNSFDDPTNVVPVETDVSGLGNSFVYEFPASSVTFIRLHDLRAPTTLAAKVAPSSVPANRTAKVTARLVDVTGATRPTGTVTVTTSDGTVLGRSRVGFNGTAEMTVSAATLGVGEHQLDVAYGGDLNFRPSATTVTLRVTP